MTRNTAGNSGFSHRDGGRSGRGGRMLAGLALLAVSTVAAPGVLSTAPALAQAVAVSAPAGTETVHVALHKSQVLNIGRRFSKAVIGDPEIADVVPLSTGSVYVLGRGMGATNLALYGRSDEPIAIVNVLVGPDAGGLQQKIAETFPAEPVRVSPANDFLMLEGDVSGPVVAERIVALAETYAPEHVLNMLSVGATQQVLLEVRVSEMSRTTAKELGISNATWSNGSVSRSPSLESGPFVGTLKGLFGSTLDVELEALERKGLVRTLANPNLVALSGESANFLAGGEIPVPSGVDNSGRVSITFKPFGVAVAFTPTVLDGGLINLRVAPEVSSLDREASVQLDGATIPGLKVRRAITSLELRDGQSFAMAGLLQSDYTNAVRSVPLLGQIPILGALFRSTGFQKGETELVIMVTPRLVKPMRADQLRLPTDRVAAPDDAALLLMGRHEKILAPQP